MNSELDQNYPLKERFIDHITAVVPIHFLDDRTVFQRFVLFFSEMSATFILLCIGCMVLTPSEPPRTLLDISLTFGFAVMMGLMVFGHISGAHMNPMLTLTSVICGYTSIVNSPFYFFGQIAGAILGFEFAYMMTPTRFMNLAAGNESHPLHGLCVNHLIDGIPIWKGCIAEFSNSFILSIVACAAWEYKSANKHESISLRFGFTVSGLVMVFAPYSSCSMNPARSFAPALMQWRWKNHWIYWVMPLSGSIVSSFLYKYLFWTAPVPIAAPKT